MKHSDLVEKYQKGQRHFEKGNFRRAKWIFERIVFELSASDSDSMGDINLHNSAQDYLDEIQQKNLPKSKLPLIIIGLIILTVLYFIFK